MSRLALLALLCCSGCACRKEAFVPPADSVLLPIADRPWAEGAPAEGWCGEASIQMVALHAGAWVPQPVINALGRPTHVDLWEDDIPTALDALGLSFERAKSTGRDEFLGWIVGQLRQGRPVIVGAKLFPSEHPEWNVDHLMPVVGFSPRGLTFNTNLTPGQTEVSYAALAGREGLSFLAPTQKFYGFAVLGFRGGGVPLRVVEETADALLLAVDLDAGSALLRRHSLDGGALTPTLRIDPREACRFSLASN